MFQLADLAIFCDADVDFTWFHQPLYRELAIKDRDFTLILDLLDDFIVYASFVLNQRLSAQCMSLPHNPSNLISYLYPNLKKSEVSMSVQGWNATFQELLLIRSIPWNSQMISCQCPRSCLLWISPSMLENAPFNDFPSYECPWLVHGLPFLMLEG